jgi:hypothetical protein
MLSIEECRGLIPGGEKMPDEEVARLRRDLYQMAELALEAYFLEKEKPKHLKN